MAKFDKLMGSYYLMGEMGVRQAVHLLEGELDLEEGETKFVPVPLKLITKDNLEMAM